MQGGIVNLLAFGVGLYRKQRQQAPGNQKIISGTIANGWVKQTETKIG
ncbi:MAG: hypothetical protein ACKOE6_10950 [Flammeovirgaceae bacterium]